MIYKLGTGLQTFTVLLENMVNIAEKVLVEKRWKLGRIEWDFESDFVNANRLRSHALIPAKNICSIEV